MKIIEKIYYADEIPSEEEAVKSVIAKFRQENDCDLLSDDEITSIIMSQLITLK
jgi:hypothetical protein